MTARAKAPALLAACTQRRQRQLAISIVPTRAISLVWKGLGLQLRSLAFSAAPQLDLPPLLQGWILLCSGENLS